MKKAIFFFAFTFVLGTFAANAQCSGASAGTATKSCCASKIAKAAAADPSIEKRQSDDGAVAYVRKEADAQGNVMFVSVQFDETANSFVNVAPASASTDKTDMTKKTAKACAGGAADGKACCKSKTAEASEGKACCKGKTAAACGDKKAEQ